MIRIKSYDGTYEPIFVFIALFLLAFSSFIVSKIAFFMGISIFLFAFYNVVKQRNYSGIAHNVAAFFVGSEVFWRMTYSGLPWEFGKQTVIILLLTAIMVEKTNRQKPYIYLIYLLCFIPAIFVPEFTDLNAYRKEVIFNVLGEVLLVISVFYFYNRNFSKEELIKIGRWMIYGLFLMSVMVLLKSPSYDAIEYGRQSNFVASGGFGPNQVSVMFGLGPLVLGYFIIKNITLFKYRSLDYLLFLLFTFQGLFTLSRGGFFGASLALGFGLFLIALNKPIFFIDFLKRNFLKIFILSFLGTFTFIQANLITDGALYKRYFNKDKYGVQIRENYTSYRDLIVKADIIVFLDNFETGVGPGQSMIYRAKYLGGEMYAAHVEYSRMLSEHGILGLLALILMFTIPIFRFFKVKDFDTRFIFLVFLTFAFLTMSHNAMRVAVPGFFYGLSFIILVARVRNDYRSDIIK